MAGDTHYPRGCTGYTGTSTNPRPAVRSNCLHARRAGGWEKTKWRERESTAPPQGLAREATRVRCQSRKRAAISGMKPPVLAAGRSGPRGEVRCEGGEGVTALPRHHRSKRSSCAPYSPNPAVARARADEEGSESLVKVSAQIARGERRHATHTYVTVCPHHWHRSRMARGTHYPRGCTGYTGTRTNTTPAVRSMFSARAGRAGGKKRKMDRESTAPARVSH